MGDEYEGLSILLYGAFEYGDYLAAVFAVEISRRLIGKDYLRLVYERPCKGYTLLLTARELVREVETLFVKSRKLKELIEEIVNNEFSEKDFGTFLKEKLIIKEDQKDTVNFQLYKKIENFLLDNMSKLNKIFTKKQFKNEYKMIII